MNDALAWYFFWVGGGDGGIGNFGDEISSTGIPLSPFRICVLSWNYSIVLLLLALALALAPNGESIQLLPDPPSPPFSPGSVDVMIVMVCMGTAFPFKCGERACVCVVDEI